MSSAAAVRATWQSQIFDNASVTAITDKIYSRLMPVAKSKIELLRYEQEYNFIQYIVQRFPRGGHIGKRRWEYVVEVEVYRQTDPDGSNFNACIDAQETIASLVISELGSTWDGDVDVWLDVPREPRIDEVEISGKRVIVATQEYRAEKYI